MGEQLVDGLLKGAVVEAALVVQPRASAQHVVGVPTRQVCIGQGHEVLGIEHAHVLKAVAVPNPSALIGGRGLGASVLRDNEPGFDILLLVVFEDPVRPTGEASAAASPIGVDEEVGRLVIA